MIPQTHKTSGDGRGWVDELSVPSFSTNVSTYIAISPIREGTFGKSTTNIFMLRHVEAMKDFNGKGCN